MCSSTRDRFTAAVLTVSDSCSRGEKADRSGPAVAAALERGDFRIIKSGVVPDEQRAIQEKLIELCQSARVVVTTGGTGVAPRDVTPEATRAVCDRIVEGLAERMRSEGLRKTRFAALSRAVCGVRGMSLVLNLPGSPTAAVESLEAVMDLLPHALDLIAGKTEHRDEPSDHQAIG